MLGILRNKHYGWSLLLLGTFYCWNNVATAAIEVSVEAIVKDELESKQSVPLTVVSSQVSAPVIPQSTVTPENGKKPEVKVVKPQNKNSRVETTQKVHALLVSLQGYVTEYFAQVESPEQQHIVKAQQESPNITKEIEKSGQPVEPEIQPAAQASSAAITHYAQLDTNANQPAPLTQPFADPQNTSSGQEMMQQDNVMQQLPPQSMPLQPNNNASANSPLQQTLQNNNEPVNTPLQQTLQKDNTIAPITGAPTTPAGQVPQQPTANQLNNPAQQQQPVTPGAIQPASPVQLPPQTNTQQQVPAPATAPLQAAPAPAAAPLQTAPATNSAPLQMQTPAPAMTPHSEAPANSTMNAVVSTLEQDQNAMDFSKLEAEFKNDLSHASQNPSIPQLTENNSAQQPLELLAENSIDQFGNIQIIKTTNHIVPDVKSDHGKVIKNIIALNILIFSILGLIVLLWQKRYSKKITTLLDELRL